MHGPTIAMDTEVGRAASCAITRIDHTDRAKLIIEVDARKLHHRSYVDGIPKHGKIHWTGTPYTYDVQEASALIVPVLYRVTNQQGWFKDARGQKQFFTPRVPGIDSDKKVTNLVVRMAVMLTIMGGIGTRRTAWLMDALFNIKVSKSAICRWIEEQADLLPDAEQVVRMLHQVLPITEAHLDEIFPSGQKSCVLVIKDEHGRLVVARRIASRSVEDVAPVLRWLRDIGIEFRSFYIDHCKAYMEAIREVYPEASVQYDYFHIIQNIWRKCWSAFVGYRRDWSQRAKKLDSDCWLKAKYEAHAKRLWDMRHIIFMADENMGEAEREKLIGVMESDPSIATLRNFLWHVWDIFRKDNGESEARDRFQMIKLFTGMCKDSKFLMSFTSSVRFLDDNFDNMITFLCVPGVKRNSLAECGMRNLRRLEQGHDGLRTPEGLDRYIRLYQSIRYLGWKVHPPAPVECEAPRLAAA